MIKIKLYPFHANITHKYTENNKDKFANINLILKQFII